MSKKWLNPPLSLQLRRENINRPDEDETLPHSLQSDSHDTATLSSVARRESSTSVAQYAFVAPSGAYLDLPSAVPFQDSFTPALPSAEFPSSARGFVTPPVTSSTADFPGATHSGHTSIVAAYQHSHLSYNNTTNPISDGRDSFGEEQHQRASNPAIHGDRTTSPASSDPMTIPQTNNTESTSGATALNRADSSVSYNSVWTIRGEDGSVPRLALDITQFPRPPAQAKASDHASTTDTIPSRETSIDDPYDLSSSCRPVAFPGHPLVLKPGVLRSMARSFNAPASPLFEESEPSSSRPLTPIAVGGVSYKYPITIGDDPPQRLAGSSPLVQEAFNSISLPLSQDQSQARENPEEHHAPVQYLAPPVPASPADASARNSSQSMLSQLTVASRGSTTSPHLSFIGERPARASNLPTPNDPASGQWDQVLSSVKAHWNSSDSVVADPNLQASSVGAGTSRSRFVSSVATSAAVAGSVSNNDNEEGDSTGATVTVPATLNPGAPSTALSPLSGESNSDVYSAIGRMSFPKPPFGVESNASSSPSSVSPLNEAAAPIASPSGSTQSPNRTPRSTWVTGLTLRTRSSRGSLKRRATEDSPLTSPRTPVVPPLPATVVVEPVNSTGSSQGHATEESMTESKGQELTMASLKPEDGNSKHTSVEAPSYKRRVSDLMRAATEPPTRESLASSIITTTDSSRNSIDAAVVGVARTASLSARAKALLTRGPSIHTVNQEATTLSYLVPSPLPSAQVSHTSLGGEPSIVTQVTLLESEADDSSHHQIETTAPLTLRRPAPIKDFSTFPESVGSAKSSTDGMGDEIILQRIQSRDVPHSAFPLNQSTPFRDYFSPAIPTSLRNQQSIDTSYQDPVINHSRNQSKSRNIRISVMSSISDASARAAKTMSWFRKKPLPDVPNASTSGLGREKYGRGQNEKNSDEDLTVLDLAKRAIEMDQYLTVGELPYSNAPGADSNYRHPYATGEGALNNTVERVNTVRHKANPVRMSLPSAISSLSDLANRRNLRTIGFSQLQEGRKQSNLPQRQDEETGEKKLKSNRKRRTMIVVLVFICVSAFLIPIGIIFGRKARGTQSGAEICDDGVMTGASCQLNSTCVCTSSTAGRCDPVAQALLDLVPLTNSQFGMNITKSSLALALWDIQGQPTDNCASQAVLVDVAPALNRTTSPTRTDWARSAILYNLLRSYDLSTSEAFRKSISSADLTSLQGSDQPVTSDATAIQFQASGFVYDLAAMNFAPTSVDWKENSGVSQEQAGRVNVVVDRVLDRMYSFATASSIQRSTALNHYWTDVLGLPESNLSNFAAALGRSPILLPFEASSPAIASFLSNTTSNNGISLPAPVSCLPALSDVQRRNVDLIEQSSFGLAALGSSPSSVEASCFPDRPVYGVLDALRLRRPFGDSRTSMRIPAAGLISQAYSRVILHSGEQLVGISGFNDQGVASSSNFTELSADPREYGTLGHLNHIALTYLQAFPTLELAKQAALFILDAQDDTAPPSSGNTLFDQTDGFTGIPTLEVAVFGSILPTDVEVFHADLATPNGTLFFGSENGDIFRRWAIRDDNDVILWSNSSTANQVVRETSTNSTAFENVWNQANEMIKAAAEVGRGTGLPEENAVMQALANASLFS
ncbi:hypothetical protein CPB86DRAFT_803401 [Serendipita vermifera]|nr:hypothetical protein CPB86DRAFT_803401 [Serendipita vermifera]